MSLSLLTRVIERHTGYSPARILIKRGMGRTAFYPANQSIEIYCGGYELQEQAFLFLHEFRHFIQMEIGTLGTADEHKAAIAQCTCQADYANIPWEYDANTWALATGKELGFINADWFPVWWQEAYGEDN
jgi:hypothetical protein